MLRNKRIQALEVFLSGDIDKSPITGNAASDQTQASIAALTLYTADPVSENDTGEYFYKVPYLALHNVVNSNLDAYQNRVFLVDDISLQWEKCQITFTQPPVPQVAYDYVIGVYYTSRKERLFNLMSKKLSGMSEGTLSDMLMTKIMQLENKLQEITHRITGR